MRLSTIPGADDRDAVLLDLEDGELFLTARVDGAHTSVQMDVRAVDRLVRDLQRWRYFEGAREAQRQMMTYGQSHWTTRTPHFSIDEDGKVTQLLPLQRQVDDLARKLLQVEMGYGWPMHATEEIAHHPYRTIFAPPQTPDFSEPLRKALEEMGHAPVEGVEIRWTEPAVRTPESVREALEEMCLELDFAPADWQLDLLEKIVSGRYEEG